jgi:hypothetical protein
MATLKCASSCTMRQVLCAFKKEPPPFCAGFLNERLTNEGGYYVPECLGKRDWGTPEQRRIKPNTSHKICCLHLCSKTIKHVFVQLRI